MTRGWQAATATPIAANAVAWAPDGSTWAACATDGLWLAPGGEATHVGSPLGVLLRSVRFTADGKVVLAAPLRYRIDDGRWDPETAPARAIAAGISTSGGGYEVGSAAWDPSGEQQLVCARFRPSRRAGAAPATDVPAGRVVLVRAGEEAGRVLHEGSDDMCGGVAIGERRFAASLGDILIGSVTDELDRVVAVKERGAVTRAFALLKDESAVVGAAADGFVTVLDAADGSETARWQAHDGDANGLDLAPDGTIVTGGEDGLVRRWTPDGRALGESKLDGPVAALAVSADGGRVLVALLGPRPRLLVGSLPG